MSEDITAAARRVLEEIFPADDEAALAELISPDVVNHEAPPGAPPGRASIVYAMHMLAKAFSDQRWTIHHALADGDLVALHCTHSGRHTGEFFGRLSSRPPRARVRPAGGPGSWGLSRPGGAAGAAHGRR